MKPTNSESQIFERLEQLEARISQLEAALNNTITFETLAARLISNPETKKARKPRVKKYWTPE
jgi:BMFP domain-containing protein YqiC